MAAICLLANEPLLPRSRENILLNFEFKNDTTRAYRPLWLFVFAAGKLGFSIPGAQTSDQHQRHNLNESKHGLPCFVVFVPCSAKLSRSFPKQYIAIVKMWLNQSLIYEMQSRLRDKVAYSFYSPNARSDLLS